MGGVEKVGGGGMGRDPGLVHSVEDSIKIFCMAARFYESSRFDLVTVVTFQTDLIASTGRRADNENLIP